MGPDPNDLEARLADLRDAMYESSRRPEDQDRQRAFLTALFSDDGPSRAAFMAVVEARDPKLPVDTVEPPKPAAGRGERKTRRLKLIFSTAAVVVLVLCACFYLIPRGQTNSVVTPAAPTVIRVGVLNVVDTAPLYRAIDQKYFEDEHLKVEIHKFRGGPDAIKDLADGKLDLAFTSYPGAFMAQARHIANVKIVAAAYAARTGHLVMMGPPDRSFTKPSQVAGKRIGVTATGSISDIGTTRALRELNVDPSKINWVPMSMEDMIGALEHRQIDGAVLAEPFTTEAEEAGATSVLDVSLGENEHLPLSGWFATEVQVKNQSAAIVAFQRALARGVKDVQNHDVLNSVLVKYLDVNPAYVDKVRIATYPQTVDPNEIQKVADLMKDLGFITERLDVRSMIIDPDG